MATVRLSDVVLTPKFTDYSVRRSVELSALYQSGIIGLDARFDALARGEGSTFTMPYFNDLSGESNVSSDDPAQMAVPQKITTGTDVAVKQMRNQSWSSMDLTAALLARDPLAVIGDLVGGYWAREMQKILLRQITGILAANTANNSGDMIIDVALPGAGTPGTANKISPTVVLAAKQTLGDAADRLTTIVMHSAVRTELQRQQLIVYITPAGAPVGFETYLGYRVVVDDGVPVTMNNGNPIYTSYLFGAGAVALGNGLPKTPQAVERVELAGNGEGEERLITRRHFLIHLRGVKWTGASMAGAAPTNAELASAANYSRVYDRKAVRFVAIRTNG